ncbi:hypothetical protein DL89DRAFT_135928 [Linderina pennispora]|uniref:Uncharacterized protein n=1 Tax=Linderina pennispora TaxID=61395 RepID=A0A1Y1WBL2_9FUNG|nr:uncharacterized protein DL89DRAFT_135928 [Linderina pennispora]ORX70544.1 hypothetical protein DL89DRAFT_135928 [Linderina pennispora]
MSALARAAARPDVSGAARTKRRVPAALLNFRRVVLRQPLVPALIPGVATTMSTSAIAPSPVSTAFVTAADSPSTILADILSLGWWSLLCPGRRPLLTSNAEAPPSAWDTSVADASAMSGYQCCPLHRCQRSGTGRKSLSEGSCAMSKVA